METKSNVVFIASLTVLFTILYAVEVSFPFKLLYWWFSFFRQTATGSA